MKRAALASEVLEVLGIASSLLSIIERRTADPTSSPSGHELSTIKRRIAAVTDKLSKS